jgi:GTP-binding protein Era
LSRYLRSLFPASERRLTRAGFVALAGRPNVGKSTLVNAVVGAKVAIVSNRVQTTRRAIRGVHTEEESQLVLVDLPGVQRPQDALTARMARRVREELEGADGALLILSGKQGVGPGDRFIARTLEELGAHQASRLPVAIAVNKIDRLTRAGTLVALGEAAALGLEGEVFPISARTGAGVEELVGHLKEMLPESPFLFDADTRSDQPLQLLAGELIREAAVRRTFHELPHAVEVVVEELESVRADLVRIRAMIWVESASQKGIVIGARGRMIKAIGSAAREALERELECSVHLDLSVRVRRDWRRDDGLLDRLGII